MREAQLHSLRDIDLSKQGREEDALRDGCITADPEEQGRDVFNISAEIQRQTASMSCLFPVWLFTATCTVQYR